MIERCSAAVPRGGIWKSTVTSKSFAAFSVPRRAIVQNSKGLFVTKATIGLPPAVACHFLRRSRQKTEDGASQCKDEQSRRCGRMRC